MSYASVGMHTSVHTHLVKRGVPFAQPAAGSLDLTTPRAACYSFGIWGCWKDLRKESVERKKRMEDKEELHVLCWEYLGDIRDIFIKK